MALQAELVAQLHTYIGQYRPLVQAAPGSRTKSVKVTGLSQASADDTYLHVRWFTLQIRETLADVEQYALYGSARGQFRLGRITPTEACVAMPPGSPSALTVTSLDIPRVSGTTEYEAAKRAIAANFSRGVCVPLYPTIAISDVGAEECARSTPNSPTRPRTASFPVTLSNLSARTVTVRYATADGSARAGADYTSVSGTLRIPSLSPSGTISVALRCRQGNQGDRTFTVNLTNPVNGALADSQAQGQIIDFTFRN